MSTGVASRRKVERHALDPHLDKAIKCFPWLWAIKQSWGENSFGGDWTIKVHFAGGSVQCPLDEWQLTGWPKDEDGLFVYLVQPKEYGEEMLIQVPNSDAIIARRILGIMPSDFSIAAIAEVTTGHNAPWIDIYLPAKGKTSLDEEVFEAAIKGRESDQDDGEEQED